MQCLGTIASRVAIARSGRALARRGAITRNSRARSGERSGKAGSVARRWRVNGRRRRCWAVRGSGLHPVPVRCCGAAADRDTAIMRRPVVWSNNDSFHRPACSFFGPQQDPAVKSESYFSYKCTKRKMSSQPRRTGPPCQQFLSSDASDYV